jgi:hypothetical protein
MYSSIENVTENAEIFVKQLTIMSYKFISTHSNEIIRNCGYFKKCLFLVTDVIFDV